MGTPALYRVDKLCATTVHIVHCLVTVTFRCQLQRLSLYKRINRIAVSARSLHVVAVRHHHPHSPPLFGACTELAAKYVQVGTSVETRECFRFCLSCPCQTASCLRHRTTIQIRDDTQQRWYAHTTKESSSSRRRRLHVTTNSQQAAEPATQQTTATITQKIHS